MKIIDKYISKNFIKAYILSLVAFMGIFIVSQFFRVVKYLGDGRFTTEDAVYYILTMLPRIFIDVSPLAVLLGSMMTVSTMASNLEIISLKTSGVSFKRIVIFPIMISLFISGVVFVVNDTIYPISLEINRELKNGGNQRREAPIEKRNAFFRPDGKNFVYFMEKINRKNGVGKKIQLIDLNKSFDGVDRIITAEKGKYDFDKKVWVLKNVNIIYGKEDKKDEVKISFSEPKYDESPDNFITKNVEPRTLNIKQLKKSIRDSKSIGADTRELIVELAKRYSFPFASVVISFLGLALGGRYVRGTSAVSLGVCILLGYGYYVIENTFETIGANGFLNPFVACWIPNIIFFGIGIYVLNKAEY